MSLVHLGSSDMSGTRQLALTLTLGFLSPAANASWHIDVPPLLLMCRNSIADLDDLEQFRVPANDKTMCGDACSG